MRRLFTLFRKNIEAHDGGIIETAGDGFYAALDLKQELKRPVIMPMLLPILF